MFSLVSMELTSAPGTGTRRTPWQKRLAPRKKTRKKIKARMKMRGLVPTMRRSRLGETVSSEGGAWLVHPATVVGECYRERSGTVNK